MAIGVEIAGNDLAAAVLQRCRQRERAVPQAAEDFGKARPGARSRAGRDGNVRQMVSGEIGQRDGLGHAADIDVCALLERSVVIADEHDDMRAGEPGRRDNREIRRSMTAEIRGHHWAATAEKSLL